MRSLRFHLEQSLTVGEEISLTGPNHHHLAKVLRLRPGAEIQLFNGDGFNYQGQILALDGQSSRIRINGQENPHNESPLALTLLLALIKGEAFERALQKAVELGVKRIVPVLARRSEAKGLKEERCRGILIASAMQCGRAVVPELMELMALEAALAQWAPGWIFSPHHPNSGAATAPIRALAIGPEGGFSGEEVARAIDLGWHSRRLGPRILRADTAATVALAQAQMLQGDLHV